jgi:hypothetical protein
VQQERAVRYGAHTHTIDVAQILVQLLAGALVGTVDGDIAHVDGGCRFHQIDRAETASALTDHHRDLSEHPRAVGDLEAEHQAERRTQDGARRTVCHGGKRTSGHHSGA